MAVIRQATVRLRTPEGTHLERIEASVLATDGATVDMARRQAGIAPERFLSGEVVAP